MMRGIGIPTNQRRMGIIVLRHVRIAGESLELEPHVPSRSPPPSVAAREAQKAPNSSEAVSQNAS
jgi:hypothetical protein